MPERATPPPVDTIEDYVVIVRSFFSSSTVVADAVVIVVWGKLSWLVLSMKGPGGIFTS